MARSFASVLAVGLALSVPALAQPAAGGTPRPPFQVDVTDHGAVCDGLSHPLAAVFPTLAAAQARYPKAVDLSQEIDSQAIQRAVDSLKRGGIPVGGVVVIPGGTCVVDTPVLVPGTDGAVGAVYIQGAGKWRTVLSKRNANGPVFVFGNAAGPTTGYGVSSLLLNVYADAAGGYHANAPGGAPPPNANVFLWFQRVVDARITHVYLMQATEPTGPRPGGGGLLISGGDQIVVDDVTGLSSAAHGSVYLIKVDYPATRDATQHATNVHMSHLNLMQSGTPNTGACFLLWITAAESLTLSDSYLGGGSVANLLLQADGSGPLLSNRFTGNYFDTSGYASVLLTGSALAPRAGCPGGPTPQAFLPMLDQQFANNLVSGSGSGHYGVVIDGTAEDGAVPRVAGSTFTGTIVTDNGDAGFNLLGGYGTTITGGAVKGNNTDAAGHAVHEADAPGIRVGPFAHKTRIAGLHVGDDPFAIGPGNQTAGIEISAAAVQTSLDGLDLSGNRAPLRFQRATPLPAGQPDVADVVANGVSDGTSTTVTLAPSASGEVHVPALVRQVVLSPTAAGLSLVINLPDMQTNGDKVTVFNTGQPIASLTVRNARGGPAVHGGPMPFATGAVSSFEFINNAVWVGK